MFLKWLGGAVELVDFFVDSYPKVSELECIPICSYERDKLRNEFIIITPLNHTAEISDKLRADGFVEGVDFISYMRYRYEEMRTYVQKFHGLKDFYLTKVGLDEYGIYVLMLEKR